ncbi:hypothetical protein ANCCEY_14064 [Ancylostoma ceylanicum]|uniref:7TM GPCR serpentine receptor class x (Srx) domain-containing protein n=1 Tax=Ancylostoma ceylanicum TaxID=53326 RepID=A0A0D6LGT3_9BILA|nr:hypothetical protein ANCCEY_14064 [Ancylostoma ceylanicum]
MITIQDYQLAALTVFMIAFLGTICNSLVAIFTQRLPSLNNAFGRLTASQAAGEMILCGIFAFYYSPMRCGFISWYFDFGQDFAVVVLISIIDTITIIRVRLTSAEIQKSGCRVTTSKRTKDVTFLKQMQVVPWSILTATLEGEKDSELHEAASLLRKQGINLSSLLAYQQPRY